MEGGGLQIALVQQVNERRVDNSGTLDGGTGGCNSSSESVRCEMKRMRSNNKHSLSTDVDISSCEK